MYFCRYSAQNVCKGGKTPALLSPPRGVSGKRPRGVSVPSSVERKKARPAGRALFRYL